MIDYSICSRNHVQPEHLQSMSMGWDIFISAYNMSTRVQETFERVEARRKLWLVQREYGFSTNSIPEGAFASNSPW